MAYAEFGATLTDTHDVVVTGAPVRLSINQQSVTSGGVQRVEAGQTLEIRATNEGVYSYLHLSGGIVTTPQLDSRSTSPREGIGGLDGGFLKDGDILPLSASDKAVLAADPHLTVSNPRSVLELRFVAGFNSAISLMKPSKPCSRKNSPSPPGRAEWASRSTAPDSSQASPRCTPRPPLTVRFKCPRRQPHHPVK